MSTQIELVFRNHNGKDDLFRFFIEPTKAPLASRWVATLKDTLIRDIPLEKDFSFQGFLGSRRSRSVLFNEIKNVTNIIQSYRSPGVWENGYDIQSAFNENDLDQNFLNKLHHHFEILTGQSWARSPYLNGTSPDVQLAVRKLNLLVHEIEAIDSSTECKKRLGRWWPKINVAFFQHGASRQPLSQEDYEYFTLNTRFGAAQMHYCQLGKTHYDAFIDNDKDIHCENINGLRYYSAEFDIGCGPDPNVKWEMEHRVTPFYKYLNEQGYDTRSSTYFIDHNGVKQGIGWIIIADTPMNQFNGKSIQEIQLKIAEHDDIYQIRIHENGTVTERTFDYFNEDEKYRKILLKELRGI